MTMQRVSGAESETRFAPAEVRVGRDAGAGAPPYDAAASAVTFVGLTNAVLRRRTLIAGLALASAFVVGLLGVLEERTYTASSSFMPRSRNSQPTLGGIAAQFGISVPGGDPGESPAFYADLVRSRTILGALVDTTFTIPGARGDSVVSLAAVFEVDSASPTRRRDETLRRLTDVVGVAVVQKTGVVQVSVQTPSAELSRQVNASLLDRINEFNLTRRSSQARSEREFNERRLNEIAGELRRAEERVQAFMQRNRGDFRLSPQLSLEYERLQRLVNQQSQLYDALAQSYEQSKLEEVRDIPVITIIERPEPPVRPDPRHIVTRTVLALLVGGAIGIAIALASELMSRDAGDERAGERVELRRLLRATRDDLLHPWRPIGRLFRRRPERQATG